MEEVRICDYCGRVLAEEEGTPVDDELLCDDCVEEHCVTCDHCGETIWEQNSVSDEDTCLCQDCFDAHYYRCESCGQIVPESIVCWHSDLPYCERCFDEFEDEIEEYSYKPTPMKCRTTSTHCSTHTIGINWTMQNGGWKMSGKNCCWNTVAHSAFRKKKSSSCLILATHRTRSKNCLWIQRQWRKQLTRQKHCCSVKHKSKRKIGGI